MVGILSEVTSAPPSGAGKVFVVDDDDLVLRAVGLVLSRAHYQVTTFSSGPDALSAVERSGGQIDLLIADLHMPGMDGFELLGRVRSSWPDLPVVVLSGDLSPKVSVEARRRGAYDYLTKPLEAYDEVVLAAARAVEHRRLVESNHLLKRQIDLGGRWKGIVGDTPAMRALLDLVESVAPTDATVLVLGESGTGKELIARAVHERSARRAGPFLPVNCSALTDTLLESELFGHVRGSFSGASHNRSGVFEEATGGTLFLDEIGDVSPATQVRLLRALQEGEIKPVGSSEIRKIDVRVVAATNRDLRAAVKAGTFRQDLYYRLNVVALELPALRHRREDIPLLLEHFLHRYAAKYRKSPFRVTPRALEALQAYAWPGNVRELENVVQRAVVLAAETEVTLDALPPEIRAAVTPEAPRTFDVPFSRAKQVAIEAFERGYVTDALRRTGGGIAQAARLCGLDKSNFRRILRRYQIDTKSFAKD